VSQDKGALNTWRSLHEKQSDIVFDSSKRVSTTSGLGKHKPHKRFTRHLRLRYRLRHRPRH